MKKRQVAVPSVKKIWSAIQTWKCWKHYGKIEWLLIIVATVTILYVFLNLFTAATDSIPPPTLSKPITLSDLPDFEKTIANTTNSSVQNSGPVTVLTNAEEFLPDLLTEIRGAKKSIYITDYIWEDGTLGNTVLAALAEKSKEGVAVRILLDGVSGRNASKELLKEITDNGGKVGRFRPVSWSNITRLDRRTHVRDFVIDGRVAYIGGVALSDAWLGSATYADHWHDFMFKVSGTMVHPAETAFENMWSQTTGEILTVTTTAAPGERVGASSATSATHFVPLFSFPSPDMSKNMEHFIWLSVQGANKSIRITNPYLLPNSSIASALEEKARAGVDVELLVPGTNIDSKYTRWASESFYKELLDSGVKIYEYQPSRIHAKTLTIDGVWSVIGSANLDNRSSEINLELIYGVEDAKLATDIERNFSTDKTKAVEITSKQWRGGFSFMYPVRLVARTLVHQF